LQQQEFRSAETFNTKTISVSVTVSNTGQYAGAEVIQCYIGQVNPATQPTPMKRLHAFEKVWLEPGEQKTVTLQVPVQHLSRYDVTNKQWMVDAGEYTLWIGKPENKKPATGAGFLQHNIQII
jgi:beta-glucosidase